MFWKLIVSLIIVYFLGIFVRLFQMTVRMFLHVVNRPRLQIDTVCETQLVTASYINHNSLTETNLFFKIVSKCLITHYVPLW